MREPCRATELRVSSGSVRTGLNRSTVKRVGTKPSAGAQYSIWRASAPHTAYPPTWVGDHALTDIGSGFNVPSSIDVKKVFTRINLCQIDFAPSRLCAGRSVEASVQVSGSF